jgi:hypothetical protein
MDRLHPAGPIPIGQLPARMRFKPPRIHGPGGITCGNVLSAVDPGELRQDGRAPVITRQLIGAAGRLASPSSGAPKDLRQQNALKKQCELISTSGTGFEAAPCRHHHRPAARGSRRSEDHHEVRPPRRNGKMTAAWKLMCLTSGEFVKLNDSAVCIESRPLTLEGHLQSELHEPLILGGRRHLSEVGVAECSVRIQEVRRVREIE